MKKSFFFFSGERLSYPGRTGSTLSLDEGLLPERKESLLLLLLLLEKESSSSSSREISSSGRRGSSSSSGADLPEEEEEEPLIPKTVLASKGSWWCWIKGASEGLQNRPTATLF